MAKNPGYIDTLAAISNGERGGYELFKKWSAATSNEKLKLVLDKVAVREAEHAWAFEKRLSELGYPLERSGNKALAKLMKLMGSSEPDEAKFHAFGIGVVSETRDAEATPDRLLSLLADTTIDPQTGGLLGRFICEERDSGRLLVAAYKSLQRATPKAPKRPRKPVAKSAAKKRRKAA